MSPLHMHIRNDASILRGIPSLVEYITQQFILKQKKLNKQILPVCDGCEKLNPLGKLKLDPIGFSVLLGMVHSELESDLFGLSEWREFKLDETPVSEFPVDRL